MSHTYSAVRVHVVFSTKGRARVIPEDMQPRLWAYIAETAKNRAVCVLAINGFDDHAHLLIAPPPTVALSKIVQELKAISSKWMGEMGHPRFAWQQGFAAFSVSESMLSTVAAYIRTQREHHARHTFEAEFLTLLRRNGVPYDPKFVFG